MSPYMAPILAGSHVLDFGSGAGGLAAGLQERCQAKVSFHNADAVALKTLFV